MNVIEIKSVFFKYQNASVPTINNVSFNVKEGTYSVLAGLNGSGKSTLSKIIAGLIAPEKGEVVFPLNSRVGIIFQSPKDQIICGTVSRDTSFGPQNLGLSSGEVEMRTIESLNSTNMLSYAKHPSMALSLGQTQKVAFSGIIAMHPDILILDESVSMLDPVSREEIFAFLDQWHDKGKTILHITHDVDAIKRADYAYIMDKGNFIWEGTVQAFFENEDLYKKICGTSLARNNNRSQADEDSLVFEKVSFSYEDSQILHDISLNIKKGTINAITGISGSGKSTFLELASGLLSAESGKIYAKSKPVLAQQNYNGALFEAFAADDVAFGPKNSGLKGKALVEKVKESMNIVGLPFDEFKDKQTFALSGGERRKLAIAGILALDSDIIMFDEPTAALDGPSKIKMMELFRQLANNGKTVIFSTHHPDEASFADRVIHLENGVVALDTMKKNQSEENKNPEESLKMQESLESASMLASLRKVSNSLASKEVKNSFVAKLNPAVKYLIFLLLFVLSIAFDSLLLSGIMVFVCFIYGLLAKYSAKKLILTMLKVVPLLLFFCVFQMVFFSPIPGEKILLPWKYFTVTPSKILLCVKTLLHTEAALCCICGFIYSTSEYDLINGLEILLKPLSKIKIPTQNAVILMEIIFRFVPLLIDETISILKTQLVRGALGKVKGFFAKIKAMIPLLVPLIVQTIKRAESLAEALTARGK